MRPAVGIRLRVVLAQVIATGVCAALAAPFGHTQMVSALAGAGIALLLGLLFMGGVLGGAVTDRPGAIALRVLAAEVAKLVLAVLLFAAVFAGLDEVRPLALIGAFLGVYLVPALVMGRSKGAFG